MRMLLFFLAAFIVNHVAYAQQTRTYTLSVDPKGNYLGAPGNPASSFSLNPLYQDPQINLQPGDVLSITAFGEFIYGTGGPDLRASSMVGVFSSGSGFLSPGSGTTAPAVQTIALSAEGVTLDISQDFAVDFNVPFQVGVPDRARAILFAPNDSFFTDNTAASFGVIIIITVHSANELAVEDSGKSKKICNASSIILDTMALQESIPLVGVPFDLQYSSDRFRASSGFNPKSLGLGGWFPNIIHRYNPSTKTLYAGDGHFIKRDAIVDSNGILYLTNANGSEIYAFNSFGQHFRTNDALTGAVLYNISYDQSGKIQLVADAYNNTTSFSYLNSNEVIITSPYGQVSRLALDSNGFLSAVTNPNNETHNMVNSNTGLLLKFKKPMGQESEFAYDESGYLTLDKGAGGNSYSFSREFDAEAGSQEVISETALGRKTSYQSIPTESGMSHIVTYPDNGVSQSESNEQVSESSVDKYGNSQSSNLSPDPQFGELAPYSSLISYSVPQSNISLVTKVEKTVTLNSASDPFSLKTKKVVTQLQNDISRTYQNNYDRASNQSLSISPMNRRTVTQFNSQGQISSLAVGSLTPIQNNYDSRGRLQQISQGGRVLSFDYDNFSRLLQTKDSFNRITSYNYDNANRVTKKTLPDSSFVSYRYDGNGNLVGLTPPSKPEHQFVYNLFEKVESYLPPQLSASISGSTQYAYNLDRQLISINRPDGKSAQYVYDNASENLLSVQTDSGSYQFSYKPNSDLVDVLTSPDGSSSKYDYVGSIVSSIQHQGVNASRLNFSYLPDGNLDKITVMDSVKSYSHSFAYDKDDLVIKSGDMSYVRNDYGAVVAADIGQLKENVSYNSFGEMLKDEHKFKNKAVYKLEVVRDNLGRIITKKEDSDSGIQYKYDSNGRLVKVIDGQRIKAEYFYDQNGNRLKKVTPKEVEVATYDAQDRLLKYSDNAYDYNANGDLIKKTVPSKNHQDMSLIEFILDLLFNIHKKKVTEYAYDVMGNLKTVKLPDNKSIHYVIDGENRRIGKKINGRLKDAWIYQSQTQIIVELDGNGRVDKKFIYGSKTNSPDYMVKDGKRYRMISDHLGSIRYVVNVSNGKVMQKMEYDEFGNVLKDSNPGFQPFGFAGGLYDQDTGLVRFGARDYDPETGRWTSKDPIRFEGGDSNLYGYVLNDPINFTDVRGTGPIAASLICPAVGIGLEGYAAVSFIESFKKLYNAYKYEVSRIESSTSIQDCDKDILIDKLTRDLTQNTLKLAGDYLLPSAGVTVAGAALCAASYLAPTP